MGLLLLIILIVVLLGGLPRWGYHSYGWGPSGFAGVVLIVALVLLERVMHFAPSFQRRV
jgi:hypothetical protein